MNKTLKIGGKYLGKGNKGIVLTIKDNNNSFLNLIKDKDLEYIHLELKNKSLRLEINEYDNFINFIESLNDMYVCKLFYTNNKKRDFQNEIDGYKKVIKLKNNIGVKYKSDILLGFIFVYKNNEILFTIMEKCDLELKTYIKMGMFNDENEYKKLIKEIINKIIQLQKLNIAHGDIKIDNIMKCNNEYKLIDWENSRDLDYEKLKNSVKPMLGSCSLYFKVYADGHNGKVKGINWKNAYYIKSKLLLKHMSIHGYINSKSVPYLNHANEYYNRQYKLYKGEELFNKLKYGLDLHAFGWLLYDILVGKEYYDKYEDLIINLYKIDAKEVLHKLKKI